MVNKRKVDRPNIIHHLETHILRKIVVHKDKKFALVGINTHCSEQLAQETCESFSIGPESKVDLNENWTEWLGSIRIEQFQKFNIFVEASISTCSPGVLDQENSDLTRVVNAGFTGLLLSRNFVAFSSPMFLTGACQAGKFSVRQVATRPCPVHEQAEISSEFQQSDLVRAVEIGTKLIRMAPKKLWRINRGIALYCTARCEPNPLERFHGYVRVLEAATKPPNRGGTTKNFCERMALLASEYKPGLFHRLYDTRGAIEHLREHDLLNDQSRHAHLQLVQDEHIAEYLSRMVLLRLICQEHLWDRFGTADHVDRFWEEQPASQHEIWGLPIDTERALDGFDPSMLSNSELGLMA